ncbi:MAG TPA: zinc ribbon domain-containing protein [Candidatus Deferrimicrobium sp.]|nr:zinc ribbon domain-containing protein [Candidatus Deferrimicrobium sp.]
MEKRNIGVLIIIIICAVALILSQNFWGGGEYSHDLFDWTSYYIDEYGWWVYVSFQDSVIGQLIPGIGYFPVIVAGLALTGALVIAASVRAAKLLCLIGGILGIVGLLLYLLPTLILQLIGSYIPFPNELGAYLFIVSTFIILIASFFIKKTEMGTAKADKQYYAIGKATQPKPGMTFAAGPVIKCPHCGATVPRDQLFCEECGQYF